MTKDEALYEMVIMMKQRIRVIEEELREIRELVTPLDPGSLPPPDKSEDQETKR